jgi:hypothetical protein
MPSLVYMLRCGECDGMSRPVESPSQGPPLTPANSSHDQRRRRCRASLRDVLPDDVPRPDCTTDAPLIE